MSFTRGARQHGGFPKPGNELKDDPGRHSRDGWTHVKDHDSTYIDGKQYRNMREWTRPCAICGGLTHAFEKAGTVDANSRFSNRTCKDHRGLMPAFERGFLAWSKEANAVVPGIMCSAGGGDELAAIKAERDDYANSVMDQLTLVGKLKREIEELKKRLAQFDLSAAMAAMPWQKP